MICTDEKEAFVVESVADEFLAVMQQHGAMVLNAAQTKQIENLIFKHRREPPDSSVVDRELIGKNASVILGQGRHHRRPRTFGWSCWMWIVIIRWSGPNN